MFVPSSLPSISPAVLLLTAAVAGFALSRFLYRPVLRAVEKTREGIGLLDWTARRTSEPTRRKTMKAIQELLQPTDDMRALLLSRAIPNQRLVRTFGLTNTFVSPDTSVHDRFRRDASGMLQGANRRGWSDLLQIAKDAATLSLSSISPDNAQRFDHFIQTTTLRFVLNALLDIKRRPEDLDHDDLRVTADLISELWSRSKATLSVDPESLHRLNYHLFRLLDDREAFPNPLDIVIPTWETMWRVVATAVAYSHDNPRYRESFERLQIGDPTSAFSSTSFSPSAQSIVTEVLRLHPPSRHIHRAIPRPILGIPTFLDKFVTLARRETADIESYHRLQDVWGSSADIFDPKRHEDPVVEGGAILAFGWGKLQCVAKTWAPMAVGVITCAVLDVLVTEGACGTSEFILMRGEKIGGREGWDGWEVRRRDRVVRLNLNI